MPRARRAPRLVAALRSERRTLRQGVVALVISTAAGFVAGLILTTSPDARAPAGAARPDPGRGRHARHDLRALEARLGTSIHAGLFHASLRHGSVLRDNVIVAIVTTLTSSLWLAVLAELASTVFGDTSMSIAELVVVSVVGGSLGSIVILVITVGLSVASFRRGWDLDAFGTPIVTALGDAATPCRRCSWPRCWSATISSWPSSRSRASPPWRGASSSRCGASSSRCGAIGRTSAASCCTWSA